MRVLNRDRSFWGFTNGFESYLNRISNYCFVTDMVPLSREIYFYNNCQTYDNAYLVDSKIKQAIEKGVVTEDTILPFEPEFSLIKYFFYLDKGVTSQSLESLTNMGVKYLDFVNKIYKNKFSDCIHEACVETETRLKDIKEYTDKLSLQKVTPEEYVSTVKTLFIFYKDMIDSPLLCVRASVILYNDDYVDIKEFIHANLNLVTKEKQSRIVKEIEGYEVRIKKNKALPGRYYLVRQFEGYLRSYSYGELIKNMEEDDFPEELYHVIRYLDALFTAPKDEPKWELNSKIIQSFNVKNVLEVEYENFEDIIRKETDFLDLKLILSKAQLYLVKSDYSNFVGTFQKFLEKYLDLIGASHATKKNGGTKRINNINDKVKRALELYHDNQNEINVRLIQLIRVCFDDSNESAIKRISDKYVPVNHPRNDFQHGDRGLNKLLFLEKLGYLINEDFGEEEYSGIFKKFLSIFGLPEENIFDQLNNRVISLLKKPNF
jgi:hypothetical protein